MPVDGIECDRVRMYMLDKDDACNNKKTTTIAMMHAHETSFELLFFSQWKLERVREMLSELPTLSELPSKGAEAARDMNALQKRIDTLGIGALQKRIDTLGGAEALKAFETLETLDIATYANLLAAINEVISSAAVVSLGKLGVHHESMEAAWWLMRGVLYGDDGQSDARRAAAVYDAGCVTAE
jgi:hypothetical protein